ncbi:MAG: DUF4097 family beta strand repeat-containing protein [Longimicrobiales bacterium]
MRAKLFTIASFLTVAAAGASQAQVSNDEWLDRCDRNRDWEDREVHCEVRVSGFRPGRGALHFDPSGNGGVRIEGWDRDSVAVHARIRAQARAVADARDLTRGVRIARAGNAITADLPETGRSESVSVELVVFVPRQSDITAETVNGPLSARNVYGSIDLQTQNGPLALEGVGGDVRARTVNGPLSVRLTGARWEGAGLDAETSNGPATVFIPENYSAELETGTRNGPLNADFPLTVTFEGRRLSRTFTTTLGRGGAPLRVMTSNGPLSLRRI